MTDTTTNEPQARKAHEQPKAADMSGLWRVGAGWFMHVPKECEGLDRCWARPGVIVDLDDPFYRRVCAGQEFKLEPAPQGSVATVITNSKLQGYRQRIERDANAPTKRVAAQREAVKRAEASGVSTGIQKPDERPKKSPKAEAASPA